MLDHDVVAPGEGTARLAIRVAHLDQVAVLAVAVFDQPALPGARVVAAGFGLTQQFYDMAQARLPWPGVIEDKADTPAAAGVEVAGQAIVAVVQAQVVVVGVDDPQQAEAAGLRRLLARVARGACRQGGLVFVAAVQQVLPGLGLALLTLGLLLLEGLQVGLLARAQAEDQAQAVRADQLVLVALVALQGGVFVLGEEALAHRQAGKAGAPALQIDEREAVGQGFEAKGNRQAPALAKPADVGIAGHVGALPGQGQRCFEYEVQVARAFEQLDAIDGIDGFAFE